MSEVEYRCFVGGLAWATNDEDLQRTFSQFGDVIDSKVCYTRDRSPGSSRFRWFWSSTDLIPICFSVTWFDYCYYVLSRSLLLLLNLSHRYVHLPASMSSEIDRFLLYIHRFVLYSFHDCFCWCVWFCLFTDH